MSFPSRPHARALGQATILAGLVACSAGSGIGSPTRAANRIAETVLAHLIADDDAGAAAMHAAVVCVALGPVGQRVDPDPIFLGRFKDGAPPVRPWSECALDTARDDRLVHVATGQQAIGYTVEWPRHVTARRVFVNVAYYIGALDAAGYICEVELAGSDWRVDSCKQTWIA